MRSLQWWRAPCTLVALASIALGLPGKGHAAGEIYFFNLLTENVFTASRFYSELFGWRIDDSPTGSLMAVRSGIPIAGMSQIEDRLPGVSESLWLAAIQVNDVAASVAKARELGATVHEDATELEGWGTYALIQDPQGAPALLVKTERILGGREGYGAWAWAELWTHDTQAASDFYRQVIGYELETVRIGEQDYSVFGMGETRHAGLMQPENPDLVPRWGPYVGVTDLRAILVRVWEAGGTVLLDPAEIESAVGGRDRIALIQDPTGAMMFLYQMEEQATPDPSVEAMQIYSASGGRGGGRGGGGGGPDINVSVNISYGFGTGWGGAYPGYGYRPFGPPIY